MPRWIIIVTVQNLFPQIYQAGRAFVPLLLIRAKTVQTLVFPQHHAALNTVHTTLRMDYFISTSPDSSRLEVPLGS